MLYIMPMGIDILSNRLKELRASRDLTQADLAELVSVTRQTIISIEKGEYVPSLGLGMRLAKEFGLPVEQVFSLISK